MDKNYDFITFISKFLYFNKEQSNLLTKLQPCLLDKPLKTR